MPLIIEEITFGHLDICQVFCILFFFFFTALGTILQCSHSGLELSRTFKIHCTVGVCISEESHKRLLEDLQPPGRCGWWVLWGWRACLADLNHFQVHPSSDFTCSPYLRSLPQSQSRALSLSLGAEHNHPHNTIRLAQFAEVVSISSGPRTHVCYGADTLPRRVRREANICCGFVQSRNTSPHRYVTSLSSTLSPRRGTAHNASTSDTTEM